MGEIKQLTEFKIDRSKWRSGDYGEYSTGNGATRLVNKEGFMCCLGQCIDQMGIDLSHSKFQYGPSFIKKEAFPFNEGDDTGLLFSFRDTRLSQLAMDINDRGDLTIKQREKRLIELFKKHGLKLEFYGDPVTD